MTDVCVVGLGKIGLPLACAIARGGHRVRGVDIDQSVVDKVNRAEEPFPGEAGLAEALRRDGRLGRADGERGHRRVAVAASDVVIVVVPLVVDEHAKPDFGAMDAATEAVGAGLRPGTLVSYETTLPVGTTRDRFARASGGARPVSSSGPTSSWSTAPSACSAGGSSRICAAIRSWSVGSTRRAPPEALRSTSRSSSSTIALTSSGRTACGTSGTAEAAELAKLAETTYRDLNIAFANELAIAAEGSGRRRRQGDRGLQQPAVQPHPPARASRSVVTASPCIPHFLLGSVDGVRLPALAREVNASMPAQSG